MLNRKKQSKAVNKTGRTAFSFVALHINHWFRGSVLIKRIFGKICCR